MQTPAFPVMPPAYVSAEAQRQVTQNIVNQARQRASGRGAAALADPGGLGMVARALTNPFTPGTANFQTVDSIRQAMAEAQMARDAMPSLQQIREQQRAQREARTRAYQEQIRA